MKANDQPSILTVCVPGVAAEPGALDLNEVLAAREQAAVTARRGSVASDCNAPQAKCDACDDSACGLDAVTDSSAGLSNRICNAGMSPGLSDACQGRIAQATSGPANEMAGAGCAGAHGCQPSFFHADSGKKALELLRMLRFDLLVTGDRLPDMPVGHLIRRVRAAWPWQKWAMVGARISTQDEIVARTLGAVAVFDAPPDWEALGSLAAIAAGKATVACGSVPPERDVGILQMAGLREQSGSRGERASRDSLDSVVSAAASHQAEGGGAIGGASTDHGSATGSNDKRRHSRRAAVL